MKRVLGIAAIMLIISGCKVFFPDRLFKIDKDKLVGADTVKTASAYVIRNGDILSLAVFSNNGYDLVDVLIRENSAYSPLRYRVKENGYVQLPMLDSVYVMGMTIDDAEKIIASKYNYFFVNPFVRLEVTNRNVYVYRGRQGAIVVNLDRDNMNLLEVIAKAGGIPQFGKSYRIRVLRGNMNNPTVFDIDLGTVEGMTKANLIVVADDVIYIETRVTAADVVYQITPVLTLLTTTLLLYSTILALKK